VADRVDEAVLLREETWWHAWVQDEDAECEQIGKGHSSADGRKAFEVRRSIVPECNEADSSWDMNQSVESVQERKSGLVAMHEPLLYIVLGDWKEWGCPTELLESKDFESMILRNIPYTSLREYSLRNDARGSIEAICYNPIKHFHKEWELLHNSTVVVI